MNNYAGNELEFWQNQIFDKNAKQIHEMHIKNAESAELEIAEKRIKRYFNGELPLTWRGIIYEINKLPELDRNRYFKELCETEILKAKVSATNLTYKNLKEQSFINKIKFLFKGV